MRKPKNQFVQTLLIAAAIIGALGVMVAINRAQENASRQSTTVEADGDHDHH